MPISSKGEPHTMQEMLNLRDSLSTELRSKKTRGLLSVGLTRMDGAICLMVALRDGSSANIPKKFRGVPISVHRINECDQQE